MLAGTRRWAVPPVVVTETPDKLDAFAASAAALTKSGTSTLELALAGVPMVVAHRAHPATAAIVRRLVTVRYASLLNILSGEEVVPELLQEHCTPARDGRPSARPAGRACPALKRSGRGSAPCSPSCGRRRAGRQRPPPPPCCACSIKPEATAWARLCAIDSPRRPVPQRARVVRRRRPPRPVRRPARRRRTPRARRRARPDPPRTLRRSRNHRCQGSACPRRARSRSSGAPRSPPPCSRRPRRCASAARCETRCGSRSRSPHSRW